MLGRWKEIVVLWFQGKRFKDKALEISTLGELEQFQKIVTMTAEELWRAVNPGRKNLPRHFEKRTQLYLRGSIKEGESTGLSLQARAEPRSKYLTKDLFDKEFEEIENAVNAVLEIYKTQENDERGFNNEVQHLGKREGFRYPEDVCTKDTDIWD